MGIGLAIEINLGNSLRLRGFLAAILLSPATSLAVNSVFCSSACGQTTAAGSGSPYYTDPATGIVYRKVHRTIERPVVHTEVKQQESTIYRPETVVSVTPETRTVYTPVITHNWEPRVRGRWNPFVQPKLEYEHVPRTHWEARTETVERRQTQTNWVTERRRVDVPQQVVKIQREERIDYEPVGRVAPQQAVPPNASMSPEAALAARLRPIDSTTPIAPLSGFGPVGHPVLATQTLPPPAASTRSSDQIGMRATDLHANGGYQVSPAQVGVAGSPIERMWR